MDAESVDSQAVSARFPFDLPVHTSSTNHIPTKTAYSIQAKDQPCCGTEEPERPLTLLGLPLDVLREIVKEVTHTNDLTALALTHSALHRLAIPHIYSRFDIVWPDSASSTDAKVGVDALTYGLSTLAASIEAFQVPDNEQHQSDICPHCGQRDKKKDQATPESLNRRRRGNDYAKYTKKFSLGNGPSEWVAEYFINKESGKMLGTLSALALARMVNLECFVWDMASGIVRDVWDSIAANADGKPSKLRSIWVRCHDNKIMSPSLLSRSVPAHLSANSSQPPFATVQKEKDVLIDSYRRIEHPSFSTLPSLRSVTVLAIDELAYVEELSLLLERSSRTLRELRVGTTSKWPPPKPQEVNVNSLHGYMGNDGVLGVLFSKILARHGAYLHTNCPIQEPKVVGRELSKAEGPADSATVLSESAKALEQVSVVELLPEAHRDSKVCLSPTQSMEVESVLCEIVEQAVASVEPRPRKSLRRSHVAPPTDSSVVADPLLTTSKLSLDVLELERITLGIKVLREAIDWTRLTNLTLLNCVGDDKLWRALQRTFAPQPSVVYGPITQTTVAPLEYRLNLKKIRTNSVSPTLITLLKETLAPNSLEWLFLHDKEEESSKVSIDSILRGPLRWHRNSLRKVMIDSSGGSRRQSKAKKWAFTRETLAFVTNKMSGIRELAFSVDYKDWHFFLQRLPRIPHLRSLYIPQVIDHISNVDTRELASQVLDIVTLRPEIEICYLGLGNKCFEIFEATDKIVEPSNSTRANHESDTENEDDDDLNNDDDSDEDDGNSHDGQNIVTGDQETGETSDTLSDESISDIEDLSRPRLDFREILFYVEKVDIFRARHCAF